MCMCSADMLPIELLQSILQRLDRLLTQYILRPLGFPRLRTTTRLLPRVQDDVAPVSYKSRPLWEFQQEVAMLFSEPCNIQRMYTMSAKLKQDYEVKLANSTACMLPSFCNALPSGMERGSFIAMDLGGSTFRVALVDLTSRLDDNKGMTIRQMNVSKIDERIRQYPAAQFFDWMAARIHETLLPTSDHRLQTGEAIPMGLAWSFPIEQTSYRGGNVQPMGKGFRCHEGILGQDLGGLIEAACALRGMTVRVDAIVNDSSATLLSQAYRDPATTMGLILGTGTNAAAFLPISTMAPAKFGVRHPSWFAASERVIVNTEVSMFGRNVLPTTRWDDDLNRNHQAPDFQPLEYMTTGRYLGEIFRLVVVEAIERCHMFAGIIPSKIQDRYSLDTAILAAIEGDLSPDLEYSTAQVQLELGLPDCPTPKEMSFLRSLAQSISHRAAAYMATAVHALWLTQQEAENTTGGRTDTQRTSVAANGSVITMYPGFRSKCQQFIADMIAVADPTAKQEVVIEPTTEAAIFGAAVAVALANAT